MLSTRQTVQDTRPVYLTPKFEPQFRRDLMLAAALHGLSPRRFAQEVIREAIAATLREASQTVKAEAGYEEQATESVERVE